MSDDKKAGRGTAATHGLVEPKLQRGHVSKRRMGTVSRRMTVASTDAAEVTHVHPDGVEIMPVGEYLDHQGFAKGLVDSTGMLGARVKSLTVSEFKRASRAWLYESQALILTPEMEREALRVIDRLAPHYERIRRGVQQALRTVFEPKIKAADAAAAAGGPEADSVGVAVSDSELREIGRTLRPLADMTSCDASLLFALGEMGLQLTDAQVWWLAHMARWAANGFPSIEMAEQQFAGLALSDPDASDLDHVRPPWPAFNINIPSGQLAGTPVERIAVMLISSSPVRDNRMDGTWVIRIDTGGASLWESKATIGEMVTGDYDRDPTGPFGDVELDAPEMRLMRLVGRVIVNVCQALDSTRGEAVATLTPKKTRRKGKRRAPAAMIPHLSYVFGMPVRVDMRQHVTDYCSGDAERRYKVRWVVRGHWRNQACGPGRAMRRRTWIPPYWKGPVSAPRLIRHHELNGTENA